MPDEQFVAIRSLEHGDWYAWYRQGAGGGGVFIREADGMSLVRYETASEARDAAWFAYGLTAPSGAQLELLL